jgi:pimeloyl-ACP methyl ester carboxylesterase
VRSVADWRAVLSTFALIHGAWHGVWCWERLVGPLRERGHEVVAPVVAARRPMRALVYLTALVPEPGLSFSDQLAASSEPVLLFEGGRTVDDEGRSLWNDADTTMRVMYGDLAPEDARWAFERLRPQAQRSQAEPSPAPPPGLRVESIIGANDRVVSPPWSRRVARERLDVEPVELPSGHFPMITHPALLADALAQLDSE